MFAFLCWSCVHGTSPMLSNLKTFSLFSNHTQHQLQPSWAIQEEACGVQLGVPSDLDREQGLRQQREWQGPRWLVQGEEGSEKIRRVPVANITWPSRRCVVFFS